MNKFRYVWSEYTKIQEVEGWPYIKIKENEAIETFHPISYMNANKFVLVWKELKEKQYEYDTKMKSLQQRKEELERTQVDKLWKLKEQEDVVKKEFEDASERYNKEIEEETNKYIEFLKWLKDDDDIGEEAIKKLKILNVIVPENKDKKLAEEEAKKKEEETKKKAKK